MAGADVGPYGISGAVLATLLADSNPADLETDLDVLDLVSAWEKVASWVAARQSEAIAEFARRPDVLDADPAERHVHRLPPGEVARLHPDEELALELGLTSYGTGWRLQVALELAARHPATAEALNAGRISLIKARKIVDYTSALEPAHARRVEDAVLPRAASATPAQLGDMLGRAVIAVDPRAAEDRERKRRTGRRVRVFGQPDGMATLEADLPAADAATIEAAVSAAARSAKAAGDHRSMDQLRADMLVSPFREALSLGELAGAGPLARQGGRRAAINVTVPASSLLGISDAPGELAGYGPITAATARELAREGIWRRLLTDPVSGEVLDVGTKTYRPNAAQDRHVRERDGRCQFPGCRRTAQRCDLDHVVSFPKGRTSVWNLVALCRRHHRVKHRFSDRDRLPAWLREALENTRFGPLTPVLHRGADGTLTWTMPTGRTYRVGRRGPGLSHHFDPLAHRPPAASDPAAGPDPAAHSTRYPLPQPRTWLEADLASRLPRAPGAEPTNSRGRTPPAQPVVPDTSAVADRSVGTPPPEEDPPF